LRYKRHWLSSPIFLPDVFVYIISIRRESPILLGLNCCDGERIVKPLLLQNFQMWVSSPLVTQYSHLDCSSACQSSCKTFAAPWATYRSTIPNPKRLVWPYTLVFYRNTKWVGALQKNVLSTSVNLSSTILT
jgi:hypothetical protein